MLEQFRKAQKALPVIEALRQHIGRQRFPDDRHRTAKSGQEIKKDAKPKNNQMMLIPRDMNAG